MPNAWRCLPKSLQYDSRLANKTFWVFGVSPASKVKENSNETCGCSMAFAKFLEPATTCDAYCFSMSCANFETRTFEQALHIRETVKNEPQGRTNINSMLQFRWWQLSSNGLHHFESENPETCIQLWHVIVHGFCCLSVVSQPGVFKLPFGPYTFHVFPFVFQFFLLHHLLLFHLIWSHHASYILCINKQFHIFLHWFLPFLLLHPRYKKSCLWCDDRRCCCRHRQGLRPTHRRAAGLGGSTEGHRIGGQVLAQKGQTPVLRRKRSFGLVAFFFLELLFFLGGVIFFRGFGTKQI